VNRKTYLKKLCRDLRRLEERYHKAAEFRDWQTCYIIIDESEDIEDAISPSFKDTYRKPKCYGLGDFIAELRSHYKPRPSEYEEGYRPHHCNIYMYVPIGTMDTDVNGKEHLFEVRGWKMDGDKLIVSACNWSLCAGACILTINKDNVKNMRIEEV
jgi:hypothetical protein